MKDKPITEEEHAIIPRALTHEINLLFVLATALDTMVIDTERRFARVKATFHFEREAKQALTRYFELVRQLKAHYENFIEPRIIRTSESTNYESYEDTRVLAQEFIRLIMMYYTKCGGRENHEKLFDFIAGLEGGNGIFTAEDINRFSLGYERNNT